MRNICAAVVAASMFATSAFAADVAPLAPGKPAGVKQAQFGDDAILYIIGVGAVIAGIAIIASGSGNSNVTPGTSVGTA